MKYKYLFLIGFVLILFSFDNVNASSINYNLRIDKNLHLYETITYNVDKKDIKNDGYYHFLTSIVNDPVYFDLKKELKYKKTKKKINNGYLVTLKHDYSYLFLSKSRIINECFVQKDLNNNNSYLSFTASDFYCAHRADTINVTINTDLQVLNTNSTNNTDNNYTWNNINKDFNIRFQVGIPTIENEPMDDVNSKTTDNASNDKSSTEKESEKENKHITKYVIIGIIGIISISAIAITIFLKSKKSSLNKI